MSASAAVTVIVAVPFASPSTVSVESVTAGVATLKSDDDAVYVKASPSGSLKLPETTSVSA
ncbi:MAG: hypothetical protein J4G12_04760, partial [Gemmatimonadetes bacterium]|nr:hypothetical protein [Gemmatimonadota bacterium]